MSLLDARIEEVAAPPGHAAPQGRDWQQLLIGAIPCAILVALVAWLAALQPASFAWDQIPIIAGAALVPALLASGQVIVMLTGGIDLSVAGLLSLVNVLVATRVTQDGDIATMLPLILLAGAVAGALNGLAVVVLRLQPFIVTLATWFVWAGVSLYVLDSPGGAVAPGLAWLSTGEIAGIDVPVLCFLALCALGALLLRSRWGMHLRAVGSDADAARRSGVPARRTLVAAYAASGLLTACAGVVLSAQSLGGDPTVGVGYLLPAVAAAVIGGTSLLGGRGTIVGAVVGAVVLAYVSKVTFALALSPSWGLIFVGGLLVGALSLHLLVGLLFHRGGGSHVA